jgi:signal transduction histidine kinase
MSKISIFYKQLIFIIITISVIFIVLGITQNLILPTLYKNNLIPSMQQDIDQLDAQLKGKTSNEAENVYHTFSMTLDGRLLVYDLFGTPLYGAQNNLPISLLIQLNNETTIINDIQTQTINALQIIEMKENYIYIYSQSLDGLSQTISLVNTLSLYTIFIGLIFAILMALFISKRITTPIQQLITFTESTDFTIEKFHRNDEFKTLMQAFSSMKKRLYQTIDALKIELEKEKKQDLLSKTFIANVSHEIRTPLAVIQSAMDMIVLTKDVKKREEYVKMMQSHIGLLERLSNDILILSKIQSQTMKVQKQPYLITHLMDEVIRDMKLIHKDIKILHQKPKHEAMLNIDKDRIKQVFMNVLNNAIKFRQNDTPIDIYYSLAYPYFDVVIYNQSDAISEEHLPFLFETFYKVNSDGFGLGLAIVSSLMQSHQGEIFVKNHHQGVEVTLRFMYE